MRYVWLVLLIAGLWGCSVGPRAGLSRLEPGVTTLDSVDNQQLSIQDCSFWWIGWSWRY